VTGVLALAVLKLALRAEFALEYDSNANRAELLNGTSTTQDFPTESFLARSTVTGTLQWRRGANILRALAGVGGKVFFNPQVNDQDVLVTQLSVEDRARVHGGFDVGGLVSYYDASQLDVAPPCLASGCNRHRDFRTGSVLARIGYFSDEGEASVSGGWRGFQYKPDATFDFQGGQATVTTIARARVGAAERTSEIDVLASYHLERRFFSALQVVNTCPPGGPLGQSCYGPGPNTRDDWFHEGGVELTFVRNVLVAAGYGLQLNLSNSFGQSLLRHILSAKISFRLPWELYATIKGQLLITHYLDPVLLDLPVNSQTFVTIEDENRNALVLDLERPIRQSGLSIGARYSFYTNELGSTPVSFMRHVVYLGVSYKIGTSR
jgi:hypothetical protein